MLTGGWKELKEAFERERPAILGALVRKSSPTASRPCPIPEAKTGWSRMADFEQWITACEGALWKPDTFKAAYAANRKKTIYAAIDDDPVATAIRELVTDKQPEWSGTTKELLVELTALVGEEAGEIQELAEKSRAD